MTINDEVRDEKLQYKIKIEAAKNISIIMWKIELTGIGKISYM